MRHYNRAWSLTIERQDPATNTLTELGVIKNLRISFRVNKYTGSVGNTGQIRVYNMPASLRATLARVPNFQNDLISPPYDFVTLRAGYVDNVPTTELPTIMRGVVFTAHNRRMGADWTTDIDANGFLAKGIGSTLDKCYEQVPAITVIADLLRTMGISDPDLSVKARQVLFDTILDVYATSGSSNREFQRLLDSLGLIASCEFEGIFIMSKTEAAATIRDPIQSYSMASGLIGVPEITKQGVKIRAQLSTKTRLLSRFDVLSESLEATTRKTFNSYLSTNIVYDGDTHGNNWFTDIEGVYPTLWQAQADAEPPV